MSRRDSSLRIVVTGLVGAFPVGGVAWDYLQYPIGLARLGHDVVYHEDSGLWPYHPVENTVVGSAGYSAEYIKCFFAAYAPELTERWHYRHLHAQSYGMSESAFADFAKSADLCLNVSAANDLPGVLGPDCLTAFLDTDPGYNQIVLSERPSWSHNIQSWADDFSRYDRYLTYAENIGATDCGVPELGVHWIKTRMPIVRDLWRDLPPPPPNAPWSTVMTWNGFRGPLIYRGQEYGSKNIEFARIASLPRQTTVPLTVALGGKNPPAGDLARQGWNVVDAPSATLTPEIYRDFIAQSRGEISTAKNVYVALRTGWFSCRTACYLAAGRPAAVQDTGFSKILPVGNGLLAFETAEQARAAIETVEAGYMRHTVAARDFAAEYLDSGKVLSRLLSDIFSA